MKFIGIILEIFGNYLYFLQIKKIYWQKNIFKCENCKIHSCNTFIYTKNDIFCVIIHNNKIRNNKDSEK